MVEVIMKCNITKITNLIYINSSTFLVNIYQMLTVDLFSSLCYFTIQNTWHLLCVCTSWKKNPYCVTLRWCWIMLCMVLCFLQTTWKEAVTCIITCNVKTSHWCIAFYYCLLINFFLCSVYFLAAKMGITWFMFECNVCIDIILMATRWLPYIVGVVDGEWGYLLHIEPVDVLLEQSKQGKVQGSQPGLLALENKWITQRKTSQTPTHNRWHSENARNKCVKAVLTLEL